MQRLMPGRGWMAMLLSSAWVLAAPACAQSNARSDSPASTDTPGVQWWLNAGILSHHFQRDLGLRERNPGGGVEAVISPDHALLAGAFRNSEDAHSRYVGWFWRPLQWGPVRAGVIVAAFDGYPRMREGGWFPAALPGASIEYGRLGVNLTVVPTYRDRLHGALAVQFKLRVW